MSILLKQHFLEKIQTCKLNGINIVLLGHVNKVHKFNVQLNYVHRYMHDFCLHYIFFCYYSSLVISDTDQSNEGDDEEVLHERRKHQVTCSFVIK